MAKVIKFDEVTSTNDVAKDLANKGAEHLTCVVASKQTAGRGRRGNVWTTLPNKSLACSIILKENANHLLPLVASLAVHDTISNYVSCSIKWPNDILVNDKKISGILAEKIGENFYILGIGINVKEFDLNELDGIAGTSIENEIAEVIVIDDVLKNLLRRVSYYMNQPSDAILKEYRKKCVTIGNKVTWKSDGKILTGVAKCITDSGSLILDINGLEHEILSGDIVAQGAGGKL